MQSPTADCMLPFADRKLYGEHKLMGGGVPSPRGPSIIGYGFSMDASSTVFGFRGWQTLRVEVRWMFDRCLLDIR